MTRKKTYRIKSVHSMHTTVWVGTLQELIDNVFFNTLAVAHSYNRDIPLRPETIRGLINAVNEYSRIINLGNSYIDIATDEDVARYGTMPAA